MFKKGKSGNPSGRPKGATNKLSIAALAKAIKRVEKAKQKKLLDHFVEKAYTDTTVLTALMKKFLPDMRFSDIMITDNRMDESTAERIKAELKQRMVEDEHELDDDPDSGDRAAS